MKHKTFKSLYICVNCGKDTEKLSGIDRKSTQKVILGGYANMLCRVCRCCLEDEVSQLARRYLDK